MSLSIRSKIILITVAILFMSIIFSSVILNYYFSQEHLSILQTNSVILAQNLKYQLDKLIKLGLSLETIEGFNEQCKEIVTRYKHISYAYVLDTDGRIYFYYNNDREENRKIAAGPKIAAPDYDNFLDDQAQMTKIVYFKFRKYYEVYIPLFDREHVHVGSICVGFPYTIIREANKKLAIISFLITIAAIAIAALLLVFTVSHWVNTPIKNLVDVIDEIRQKNILDKNVDIVSNDEIGKLAKSFNNMINELNQNREALLEKNRIEKEFEIAKIIQTSILPKNFNIPGYELLAYMKPAEEVGGDYYDVIHADDGSFWISIGDVTGHGLTAGLIMMMLQAVFLSSVNSDMPEKNPKNIYIHCNNIIYQNLKNRLMLNQFITSCFFKVLSDGQVDFAGAHEHVLIYRSSGKSVEVVETDGLWLGMLADISKVTKEYSVKLEKGDMMLIYTDGLIQIKDKTDKQYSLERLLMFLKANGSLPLNDFSDMLKNEIESFCAKQQDDISFVILKKNIL